ncbi:hypothetical protein H4219_005880 [Mycoemilia scoparia]|uniref:tRNA pseudouridine(55) synthase n=1 Tax=Mycoemilia scoparia TaxID=417184 RepID=A0A9W8DP58_9FUNG|nr:hypothetical protein H4219_005880 [Mycoemilia scoparia]
MGAKDVALVHLNGLLPVNKPAGITSNGIVGFIKNIILKKDPLPFKKKQGYSTDTLDLTGVVNKIDINAGNKITKLDLVHALSKYVGTIEQTPPVHSALKMDGKPLYHYARNNIEPPRPIKSREIDINSLDLLSFTKNEQNGASGSQDVRIKIKMDRGKKVLEHSLECSSFKIQVDCSGGTYIRKLIEDIGREMGAPAFTSELVRVKQGKFRLGVNTVELDDINNIQDLADAVITKDWFYGNDWVKS